MIQTNSDRGTTLARFVVDTAIRPCPPAIIEAAKRALIDHIGVAIGGANDRAALGARALAEAWAVPGRARIILGGTSNAAMAAFANGTAAHCLDFDDTHPGGAGHISAPVWSTALAVAADSGLDEMAALRGFLTGYEVMARLGMGGNTGIGRALHQRGLHPTSINGGIGAAAAASAMLGQDQATAANALRLAATSAGGLVASFGTDAKPFHAGRAALNGILAADLAGRGLVGGSTVFETGQGMLAAFIQDSAVAVPPLDFGYWEIENNGYKPFACCRAAHATIQAAHHLTEAVLGQTVTRLRARVHWSAQYTAGYTDPQTSLEAKFSVAYCLAAALCGRPMGEADFAEPALNAPEIRRLLPLVEVIPIRDQPQAEAYLDVWLDNGTRLDSVTQYFLGHPLNPMTDAQFAAKFLSLVEPVLGGAKAERLFAVLLAFDQPGALAEVTDLCVG